MDVYSGYVLFGYGRSLTSPIDITASGGASSIATELLTLSDLFDQGKLNHNINIRGAYEYRTLFGVASYPFEPRGGFKLDFFFTIPWNNRIVGVS